MEQYLCDFHLCRIVKVVPVHNWSFSPIEVSLPSLIYVVASFFESAHGHQSAEFTPLKGYLKECPFVSGAFQNPSSSFSNR